MNLNFVQSPIGLFLLFLTGPLSVKAQQVNWTGHRKAAIVLTYDDALPTQLDNAAPELEKAGLKATFFLTSDIDSLSIPRWRELSNEITPI